MNTEAMMSALQFLGRVLSVNQNKKLHEIIGSILAGWAMYEGVHSIISSKVMPLLMQIQSTPVGQ